MLDAYLGSPAEATHDRLEDVEETPAPDPMLELVGVRAAYGRIEVLHGVDLVVPRAPWWRCSARTAAARPRPSRWPAAR